MGQDHSLVTPQRLLGSLSGVRGRFTGSLRIYSEEDFTGKKSYHFVISLENPVADRTRYRALVRRIHRVVQFADQSTKNPSRLSRFPGVIRPDTGLVQELVELRKRVGNEHLEYWLREHGVGVERQLPPPLVQSVRQRSVASLSTITKDFIYFGVEQGARNSTVFAVACDMTRAGFSREEIQILISLRIPIEHEFLRAIDRGIQIVRGSGMCYSQSELNLQSYARRLHSKSLD